MRATSCCEPTPCVLELGHGFIASQKEGMEVFAGIDPQAPLIVAEAVWQYSHHILHGLVSHRGPILTVANWSGTWPGLVGMLNLNGSLTKAGVKYSTLWSENFSDDYFTADCGNGSPRESCRHKTSHVVPLKTSKFPRPAAGWATPWRGNCNAQGDHGRLRRGMHGHVQRHHPGQSIPSHRRL